MHRLQQLTVRTRPENLDGQRQIAAVMNAAGRVISDTRKSDQCLKRLLHDDLHWLDVPQRVTYKLCLLVFKCLHGLAAQFLAELCISRK